MPYHYDVFLDKLTPVSQSIKMSTMAYEGPFLLKNELRIEYYFSIIVDCFAYSLIALAKSIVLDKKLMFISLLILKNLGVLYKK